MKPFAFARAQRIDKTAFARGGSVSKRRAKPLSESQQAAIDEMVAAGRSDADIAFSLGVNRNQVYFYRRSKCQNPST